MTRIGLFISVCLCLSGVALAGEPSGYELKGSADMLAGKKNETKGKASVVVTASPGWHINEKAPLTLAVKPPSGVVVRKKKLARADLTVNTREEARFEVPVSVKKSGTHNMTVEAKFVICKAELCTPQTEELTIALNTAGAEVETPKR